MHIRRYAAILLLSMFAMVLIIVTAGTAAAQAAEINGFVWNDKNIDGLYQKDEPFLSGIEVTLYENKDGQELAANMVTTGNDGRYRFTGLDAGKYKISVILPEDTTFTTPADGGSKALPASGSVSSTDWFTLTEGEMSSDVYIIGGSKYSSYLIVYAFEDSNTNGGRFSTEPMMKCVQIDLLYNINGREVTVTSKNTDSDGVAAFRGLTPAEYRVSVTLPFPYVIGPLGQKFNTFYNCIQPSETNTGISKPFDVPAKGSLGMAVGAVKTGTVNGVIWYDANINGKLDASEQGYISAKVILESPSMKITRTVEPNPDGTYEFAQVQPGAYQLSIHLPDDTMFTVPGGDSLFSDASFTQTTDVSVTAEKATQVHPVGVMPVTSFELVAFHDLDYNGQHDVSDTVFAGAKVNVLRNGTTIAQAITDENGIALIPVIRGGSATVQCILPDNQVFSVVNETDSSYLSALEAVSELTSEITIPDAMRTIIRAGVTVSSSVGGQVFEDTNNNGIMDSGEVFMPDITVQAINADGITVRETTTGSDGSYELINLLPSPHTIRFVLLDPYIISMSSMTGAVVENAVITQTPAYGDTLPLSLLPGQKAESIDAGMFKAGVVTGYVLLNANHDNLLTTEGGLSDVRVELLDENGMTVSDYSNGNTDETGYYYIKGVLPGRHSVKYILPDNSAFSSPFTEDPIYNSEVFEMLAGSVKAMATLGAVTTGNLSGVVWQDVNANGVMDNGEEMLEGVGINAVSKRTGQVHNASSGSNGHYILPGLRPGDYLLTFTLPDGMVFTDSENAPVPSSRSNISQNTVSLEMGQNINNADIGVADAASLDGIVFYDANNSAIFEDNEAVIGELVMNLEHVSGKYHIDIASDVNGSFSIPAIIPGSYFLSVKIDSNCILSDGIPAEFTESLWKIQVQLENGESISKFPVGIVQYASMSGTVWSMDGSTNGVGARQVNLYSAIDNTTPVKETTTANDGAFMFKDLKPGSYFITMDTPGEYRFAREADTKIRTSWILSDIPGACGNGSSKYFDIPMGGQLTGYDIGIGAMGKLGDTAWLDLNNNGMQDGGEPGMPGIVVSLFQYGTLAAETTTDLYGRYLFTGLFPGTYNVTVTMHEELKPTILQTEFPLVASVLPETNEMTATVQIVVPSGGRNMNCDFGFILREKNQYPAIMGQIPTTDWSPINIKQ